MLFVASDQRSTVVEAVRGVIRLVPSENESATVPEDTQQSADFHVSATKAVPRDTVVVAVVVVGVPGKVNVGYTCCLSVAPEKSTLPVDEKLVDDA